MNNPLDKVYLDEAMLDELAEGGEIGDSGDTYTANEDTIYMTPYEREPLYKHNIYLHLYNNSVDVRLYLSFLSNSSTKVDDSFIDANFDIMKVDTKNSIDEVDFTTKPIQLLECAFATGGGTCKVLEWTGSAVIEKSLTGNGAVDTVTEL